MSGVSIPVLATSVFFTAFSAFGAGYLMSPPPARTADSRPIIDPDAWNKTAPVEPGFQAYAQPAAVDAAMQTAAADLDQRGWVAPPDGPDPAYIAYNEDIQPLDISGRSDTGSYAVEPLEGAGATDDQGSATIMVLDKSDADRAWDSATPISVSN